MLNYINVPCFSSLFNGIKISFSLLMSFFLSSVIQPLNYTDLESNYLLGLKPLHNVALVHAHLILSQETSHVSQSTVICF